MTWRRRSDCTVSALGVGRGTRRGWWHGTRLVMTVSQDLAVGLVDSEAVAEGGFFFPVAVFTVLWFACFIVPVETIINHWKGEEKELFTRCTLSLLMSGWWITMAVSLSLGDSRRRPSTLRLFEAHLFTGTGVLWLVCYCLLFARWYQCLKTCQLFQIKG